MTAVQWLIDRIDISSPFMISDDDIKKAIEMEKQQIEISDEDIEKAVNNPNHDAYDFREGAQWYREQIKNKIKS